MKIRTAPSARNRQRRALALIALTTGLLFSASACSKVSADDKSFPGSFLNGAGEISGASGTTILGATEGGSSTNGSGTANGGSSNGGSSNSGTSNSGTSGTKTGGSSKTGSKTTGAAQQTGNAPATTPTPAVSTHTISTAVLAFCNAATQDAPALTPIQQAFANGTAPSPGPLQAAKSAMANLNSLAPAGIKPSVQAVYTYLSNYPNVTGSISGDVSATYNWITANCQ